MELIDPITGEWDLSLVESADVSNIGIFDRFYKRLGNRILTMGYNHSDQWGHNVIQLLVLHLSNLKYKELPGLAYCTLCFKNDEILCYFVGTRQVSICKKCVEKISNTKIFRKNRWIWFIFEIYNCLIILKDHYNQCAISKSLGDCDWKQYVNNDYLLRLSPASKPTMCKICMYDCEGTWNTCDSCIQVCREIANVNILKYWLISFMQIIEDITKYIKITFVLMP